MYNLKANVYNLYMLSYTLVQLNWPLYIWPEDKLIRSLLY